MTRFESHHEDPQGKRGLAGMKLAGKAMSNDEEASVDENEDHSGC